MKKLILVIVVFFFCTVSFAQVEGVEVEKPQEETKEENKEKEEEKEEDEEKIPLIDKLFFGGNFGASFGRWTFVDISPMVGYRVTPRFSVGVGTTYQYQSDRDFDISQSVYGGRLFSRYTIATEFLGTGNLFAHAEYEALFAKLSYGSSTVRSETTLFPAFFIGGGLAIPIGNRSAFTISALYNPFYNQDNTLYGNPLQIRVGGFF